MLDLLGFLDAILRLVGLGRDAQAAATWKPDEARVRREVAEAQLRLDTLDHRSEGRWRAADRDRPNA